MKTLYFECAMGAAGDMLMSALYELYSEKEQFLADMNRLIPGVTVEAEQAVRQGIAGTRIRVRIHDQEEGEPGEVHSHGGTPHSHRHAHHSLADIYARIDTFALPQSVLEQAKAVYSLLAQAESRAHGTPVTEVHFHEVGALDAIVDITGVCWLLHLLAPDKVTVSPIHVGSGTVRTAHGILPVPAPATAYLLEGMAVYSSFIEGELCTPTGAALLKTFAAQCGNMPAGVVRGCGIGCGTKDFPRANCVRACLLETETDSAGPNDQVVELKANIDDMTGETLGFAMEQLLAAGALDVWHTPIQMKKNRPAVLLRCLCRPADSDRLAAEILRCTSTFGVRRTDCPRYAMSVDPNPPAAETEYGTIRRKAGMGYGAVKCKPEYEDLAAAARKHGVSPETVREAFYRAK